MSLLCNKDKTDQVSEFFGLHKFIYCQLNFMIACAKLYNFQTMIDGNLANASAGVFISVIAYQCKQWYW